MTLLMSMDIISSVKNFYKNISCVCSSNSTQCC